MRLRGENNPMLGIIILNYNSPEDAKKCITSIKGQDYIDYKIYLVDNNSSDRSRDIFIEEYSGDGSVELIFLEANKGYSYGNNVGIRRAIADDVNNIIITNPDIIFCQGALKELVNTFSNNTKVSVVCPQIMNSTECGFKASNHIYTTYDFSDYIKNGISRLLKIKPKQKSVVIENGRQPLSEFSGMGSGCCFAITKDCITAIGCFEEEMFLYYEELVLAAKLINNNYLSAVSYNSIVIHNHTCSTKNAQSYKGRFSLCHSLLYYWTNYCDVKRWQKIFVYILHAIRYGIYSIKYRDYRGSYMCFLRKCGLLAVRKRIIKSSN